MKILQLGAGPMSLELIKLLHQYNDEQSPLMIIPSRNQVDYQDSYVCDTAYLTSIQKNHKPIQICRDHCGPYFKDSDQGLPLEDAIIESINTIREDIRCGINFIHIDTSRVPTELKYEIAKRLIETSLELNSNCQFEFGSEENTGILNTEDYLKQDLEFASNYPHHIKYIVSQTGSLVKERQVGNFYLDKVAKLAELIHSSGFLFKEHNADYLTSVQINDRLLAGVDAVNIAPELGTLQTKLLVQICQEYKLKTEWVNFYTIVLKGQKWKKWLTNVSNPTDSVFVAGHYHFNSPEYLNIMSKIDQNAFAEKLKYLVYSTLNQYTDAIL